MNQTERLIPAPIPTEDSRPFWSAAGEGRFLLKHCRDCKRAHWYPRSICPFCHSEETEWRDSPGTGSIYTYSVMRRAKPPYVVAFVTLDEGPTMLSNIVDCDPDALQIGQKVRVVFRKSDGEYMVPVFQPVPESGLGATKGEE